MRKILFSIILLFTVNAIANAQAWDGKGDTKINVGYEFYNYSTLSNLGNLQDGLLATIDYGITNNISVGTGVDYNFNTTNFYFNIRTDYHFQHFFELSSNFDVYAGADVGFNTYHEKDWEFGFHVGSRFMFTDVVGIYLEIGNRGNIGLSYNF